MIDKRIIITIGITIALIVGLVGIYAAVTASTTTTQQSATAKTDSTTNETYYIQPSSLKNPFFLGTKDLITYGMSANDVDTMQSNISEYLMAQKDYTPGSKISVDKATFKQIARPDSTIVDYSFSIIVNDSKTYIVKLHTDGITSRTMELTTTDGSVLKNW